MALAEKLRASVESLNIEHEYNDKHECVTISIGLFFRKLEKDDNIKTIYKESDELLYRAKENGRNKVETESS